MQPHFQQKYASTVLELETLNTQLNEHINGVQKYCQEVCTYEYASVVNE